MKLFSKMNKILKVASASFCATVMLLSCSKWDDYKKHLDGGEILYTGKLDSAKIFSGKERIQVYGLLNSDPKIVALKVFWNDMKDSMVYDIKPSVMDTFRQIIQMPEGIRAFEIRTYDAKGNISVPMSITGASFGDAYRRKLANRSINEISFKTGHTMVVWEQLDMSLGGQYTELEYTDSGRIKRKIIPLTQDTTLLEGLDTSTNIRYRTIFKPQPTSIDTFEVAYTERFLKIVPQLKNRKVPFIASSRNGRWGTLADWQSNSNVKIHAGGHGGWDEWNGNIFNVESGWGAPAVTNGKIWQNMTVDPGTYIFEISDLRDTNLLESDNTYIVVSDGNGLPDVAQVATAIGFTKIFNGKPVSSMKVEFTITQRKEISMGYLTTQADGNPGKFCNIIAFNFYEKK